MATPVIVPPKPTHDPDVHLKAAGARKAPRTLKGDIRSLKGKVSTARSKWAVGRKAADKKKIEVRKEAAEVLAPLKDKVDEEKRLAGEVMKPVYGAMAIMRKALDPSNGKTRPYVTSFMISSVASWAIGPQIVAAAYERIRFGTSTTGWGILNGPGRWFRDTLRMARESGQMNMLIWAAAMGLIPMILLGIRNMSAGYLAQGTYHGRLAAIGIRWLTRAAYLAPLMYFVGVSYPDQVTWLFGSPWTFEWWHFWVAGLFCSAYYGTMWAFDRTERLHRELAGLSEEERIKVKHLGPGLFHALLMTPLASIVTGFLLDAPGAAW